MRSSRAALTTIASFALLAHAAPLALAQHGAAPGAGDRTELGAGLRHAATVRPSTCAPADGRLEAGERVLGVVVGDEPRAYAVSELRSAGTAVHDVIAGSRIDVGIAGDAAGVVSAAVQFRSELTNWGSWSSAHPATSLWRMPAIPEPETSRAPQEVRVRDWRGYHTVIGCAMAQSRMTSPDMDAGGLYVISGSIENTAGEPVHHVVLRYELVDAGGKVVYRDEGFNRAAEILAAPPAVGAGEVVPIAVGASDTFRMILLSQELPVFAQPNVTVARVY